MQDCQLLNHPNVNGEGCPCGEITRTPWPPLPYPAPRQTAQSMLRDLVDDDRARRTAAWYATSAARSAT